MSRYLPRLLPFLCGFVALIGVFYGSDRADAAESVVLKYLFLRETVSVPELTTFAQTGELSTSLKAYLKLAGRDPAQLRRALTQEVKANGNFLYGILNNPVGEAI